MHHLNGRRARVALFFGGLSLCLALGSVWSAVSLAAGPATDRFDEPEQDVRVCSAAPSQGTASCHAHRRTDAKIRGLVPARSVASNPVQQAAGLNLIGNNGAYDPSYLRSAYNLASASQTLGSGSIVAIVDAYDAPTIAQDLSTYRSQFGLSPCTVANGCFQKLNQNGVAGAYPAANSGWAQEISLDVDMVSAICPNCRILLVEANSSSLGDLGTAVNTAVAHGAVAVSNSYGGGEFGSETSFDSAYYQHAGVAITASSGDGGYGVEYPAASQYVTAVGGTTLYQSSNGGSRNASETVWKLTGSGCSAFESKPAWQHDTGCAGRTVGDVSAVADPATGVWVYDSYGGIGQTGWLVFGGTSVSSPVVAATYALAGGSANSVYFASLPYGHPTGLFDITSGSDGSCGTYLCNGGTGYDGPTGLGSPNGTAAFQAAITGTPTATPTSTVSATATTSPTSTASPTATPTSPATSTPSPTATASPTVTAPTPTFTPTQVAGPTFRLGVSPSSITVTRGQSGQFNVSVSVSGGYSSPVSFRVSGLPALVTGTALPGTIFPPGTTAVSIHAFLSASVGGPYTLTVTGTGFDGTVRTATEQLIVN